MTEEAFSQHNLRENTEVFLNNILKRAQENLGKDFKKMFDKVSRPCVRAQRRAQRISRLGGKI